MNTNTCDTLVKHDNFCWILSPKNESLIIIKSHDDNRDTIIMSELSWWSRPGSYIIAADQAAAGLGRLQDRPAYRSVYERSHVTSNTSLWKRRAGWRPHASNKDTQTCSCWNTCMTCSHSHTLTHTCTETSYLCPSCPPTLKGKTEHCRWRLQPG